ncbi:hypothetical protein BH10BAC5_BH10BAC5_13950 [soil metagenome]
MKKLNFLIFIFVTLALASCSKNEPTDPKDLAIVYVCSSNSAKTYHTDKNCSGLKGCSKDILEVKVYKARENERTICNICYKRDKNEADTNKR